VARPAPGPALAEERSAVVAVPEGPLVVRSRRAGDRVRAGIRDVSLKRFLIDRRVPADLRPRLPLVAAGNLVLWVPGQLLPGAPLDKAAKAASGAGLTPAQRAGGVGGAPLAPPTSMTTRFVRLELHDAE